MEEGKVVSEWNEDVKGQPVSFWARKQILKKEVCQRCRSVPNYFACPVRAPARQNIRIAWGSEM